MSPVADVTAQALSTMPLNPCPVTPAEGAGAIPLVIDVERLFRGQPELQLLHRDQVYRLRITKQGKLILTK